MQHPDDNLLTEWLDGELDSTVAAELDAHLAQCTACHARAQALRAIATEADDLLGDLEANEPLAPASSAPLSNPAAPAEHGSPVVLLPYNEMPYWRRSSWRRTVGIAATIVVVAGAGWLALRPDTPGEQVSSRILSNASSPEVSPTMLDSGLADAGLGDSAAAGLIDSAGQPATLADAAAGVTDSEARVPAPDSDAGRNGAPVTLAEADTPAPAAAEQPSFGQPSVTPVAPRRERAPASESAAFSTGISAGQPERVTELKAAAPPREPLAIERDAQLSTRIGLDEAKEQLGGNLHVIEGLRPEMVGLVPGRLVAGADPSRPVVRVVYLGEDGKTFFLDQQRVADGLPQQRAALSPAPGSWMAGNVQLRLHGELPQDSLNGLARRVK